MGTSKSSSGSPSGAPLVPPWVPKDTKKEPAAAPKEANSNYPKNSESDPRRQPLNPKLDTTSPNAPDGRFRATRGQLGRFARSGDSNELKRGVGSYSRSGLGGKKQASRRFMGSANAAGNLYRVLTDLANNTSTEKAILQGKEAVEIIDSIVDATRSLDGTQDSEACRASINDALVELFEIQPNADLLNLNSLEKEIVIERFIASEIFRRFILDVGSSIRNKAQNATIAASRLKEAKEYIREVVIFSLKKIKDSGKVLGSSNVRSISKELLNESFSVFEDYI